MRILMVIVLLVKFCNAYTQNRGDTAQVILTSLLGDQVDRTLFNNGRHSPNCFYVIKNEIIEPDSTERIESNKIDIQGYKLLFYPRKYLIGFDINYWIQVDRIEVGDKDATLWYRAIYSKDNWFPEYDEQHYRCKLNLERFGESWRIVRREVTELKALE